MDIDWKTEIKRPVTLILAALTLVGWIVAISESGTELPPEASTNKPPSAAGLGELGGINTFMSKRRWPS